MTPYVNNAMNSYQTNAYSISSQNSGSSDAAEGSSEKKKSSSSSDSTSREKTSQKLSELLANLPKGPSGNISFTEISQYLEQAETQFDNEVKAELKDLGVDVDTKFQLIYDESTGKITVGNDHPDKKKIEAYFAANPERVKQFNTILDLHQVEDLAQNRLNPPDLRKQISQQSMAFWLSDNSTSEMFTGIRGLIFDIQNSYMKTLNMRV